MGKGSVVMTAARQQQLKQDRLRTKAISMYIKEHRENLIKALPLSARSDSNRKRKELERMGRAEFKRDSHITQGRFLAMAAEGGASEDREQLDGLPNQAAAAPQEKSATCSGVLVVATPSVQRDLLPAAREPEAPSRGAGQSASEAPALRTSVTVDSEWNGGLSATPLHDRWVRCAKSLREVYGDAASFEVLAIGIRILEVVDLKSEEFRGFRDSVKLAAVAGLAAKQVTSQASVNPRHVLTVWAKIAGKSCEGQVRQAEKRLLMQWARHSL